METNLIITNVVTNYLIGMDAKIDIWSKKFIFVSYAGNTTPIMFLIILTLLLALFLIYIIKNVNNKIKFFTIIIGSVFLISTVLIFLISEYVKEDLKKEITSDLIHFISETNTVSFKSNNIFLRNFYSSRSSFYYDVMCANLLKNEKESAILFEYRSYILSNKILNDNDRWTALMNYFKHHHF